MLIIHTDRHGSPVGARVEYHRSDPKPQVTARGKRIGSPRSVPVVRWAWLNETERLAVLSILHDPRAQAGLTLSATPLIKTQTMRDLVELGWLEDVTPYRFEDASNSVGGRGWRVRAVAWAVALEMGLVKIPEHKGQS